MNVKELKSKAKTLSPLVRIGKNGLKDSVLQEIDKHLKTKKLVKIKFLRACLENNDKDELINKITNLTKSLIISKIGNTITIYRAKNGNN